MSASLVGSEMCIRDSAILVHSGWGYSQVMTAASPTGQLLSLQLNGPRSGVALATFYRRDGTVESSIPSELAAHMAARPGCEWVVT
eukprot:9471660-Alexandrium_andersonii.AAC.1